MATAGDLIPEIPVIEETELVWRTVEISDLKLKLVNRVCAALIHEPRYYSSKERTASDIEGMCRVIAETDPEFVLKLAYYVREDLSIRSTANFILAVACTHAKCLPFIRKYLPVCTRLPTDVLEVVDLYEDVRRRNGQPTAMPGAMRKAIADKFAEFDLYQLAKYNHESARQSAKKKEKAKAAAAAGQKRPAAGAGLMLMQAKRRGGHAGARGGFGRGRAAAAAPAAPAADDMEIDAGAVKPAPSAEPKKMTLKRLVRTLHISQPAFAVMSILGKRYPATAEEFAKSGLSGEFDAAQAGKRMRLPTPETWETAVSAGGNKAAVWESLIDHNKLPFMAGLRNLRSLIKAGISEPHHRRILGRLESERAVAGSRQFPYRFLAAYDVLDDLSPAGAVMQQVLQIADVASVPAAMAAQLLYEAEWNVQAAMERYFSDGPPRDVDEAILQRIEAGELVPHTPHHRHAGPRPSRRQPRAGPAAAPAAPAADAPKPVDAKLVARYRGALDTAVKLATASNVAPLPGYTAVFCDVSGSMRYVKANTAKGLGRSNIHPYEISMLLGLMIHYVSEQGEIQVFGSRSAQHDVPHAPVAIPAEMRGSILQCMQLMRAQADTLGGGNEFFYSYFEDAIIAKKRIDRMVVLSDVMIDSLDTGDKGYTKLRDDWTIPTIVAAYREQVNPDFQFISVDLYGSGKALTAVGEGAHPGDILITGYSERILQFLAQKPDAQLAAVERMHERIGKTSAAAAAGAVDDETVGVATD